MILSNLLWTQGISIIAVLSFSGLLGYYFFRPLFYLSIALFAFSFYFFRSPERICIEAKKDNNILICPADGTIVDVTYDPKNKYYDYAQKVSIFLSPLDVHVNWTPMAGTIETISYTPGKFMPAFLPKASEENEHLDIIIKDEKNRSIMVRQIAGFIARRICWWINEGQIVPVGYKYGMIRFGSRVDIYMPASVEIAVSTGMKVLGGQSVLGRWS